ncbi:MAG: hypothetical protein MUC50_22640 [Myxococcota bacterium]|nr:hypothetical protein [Myxococcota bacterium]
MQIRYRSRPVEAEVHRLPDNGARVVFETPQKAVTKGQALAVYEGDRVIGGGWIDKAH